MEISNKVALITGGASGLGLATAEVLIESGCKVMLLDLNEDNAKSAAENLGSNAAYVIANVTDESSVQSAIDKTAETFEALNIVVNCAGIGSASKTVGKDGAHPLDYFKTVVDINLNGTFNVLRLAAVAMGNNEPNGTSSIYIVSFGDLLTVGLQNGGVSVRDLGEAHNKPAYVTRCECYVSMATIHGRSVARLANIDTAQAATAGIAATATHPWTAVSGS